MQNMTTKGITQMLRTFVREIIPQTTGIPAHIRSALKEACNRLDLLSAIEESGLTPERAAEIACLEEENRLFELPVPMNGDGYAARVGKLKITVERVRNVYPVLVAVNDRLGENMIMLPCNIKATRAEAEEVKKKLKNHPNVHV